MTEKLRKKITWFKIFEGEDNEEEESFEIDEGEKSRSVSFL